MRRQRVLGDPSIWLVTIALLVMEAGTAAQSMAQELPHPREMGFTEVPIQIPDTARFEFRLENGMTGFVVQDLRAPLVQFSAFIRVGTGDANKRGVAEVLAMLLRRGPCWMGPNRFPGRSALHHPHCCLRLPLAAFRAGRRPTPRPPREARTTSPVPPA